MGPPRYDPALTGTIREDALDGLTCTSETCPCRTVGTIGPAIGSLVNDQQHTDYIVFPLFAGTLARCVLDRRRSR